jgi:hypothetical protein
MATRKSQSSMELIFIVAFSIVILIVSSFLLLNYANYSTGKIINSMIYQIGESMVTNANVINTYGPPAKIIVEYNLPPRIENISVVNGHLLLICTTISGDPSYSGFDSPANITAVFTKDDFTEGTKKFKIEAYKGHVEIRRQVD